jgi:hypothetical protein
MPKVPRQNASRKRHDVYAHYREKLNLPKLTNREIDEIRQRLQEIARAICEHVWNEKFF